MRTALRHAWIVLLALGWAATARAQADPTVLYLGSERLTALALHQPHFHGFARLGFGTEAEPWHPWFGAADLYALLHVPGFEPGAEVEITPANLLGSGFGGRSWESAFDALASFDADGNGIVEREEMDGLTVWVDYDSSGSLNPGVDGLYEARSWYAGFDLRAGPRVVEGEAQTGRLLAFAGMRRRDSRSHLLELPIRGAFPSRDRAVLSHASLAPGLELDGGSPLSGRWRWKPTSEGASTGDPRPWGETAGGTLLLAVRGERVHGVVQYMGAHRDFINLPLEGVVSEDGAEWTSVSPLGLTRSTVRLEPVFGRPMLRGRAFGNRDGKVREWTWSATYERPLD